jgi:hypothetical protein
VSGRGVGGFLLDFNIEGVLLSEVTIHRQLSAFLRSMELVLLRQDVAHTRFWLRALKRQNQESTSPVTAPGGPVVSLTTHGGRVDSVYLALESIAAGTVLPSRLILWLDDEATRQSLPETIHRLQRRGLEVELGDPRYGPHEKYYPYLESQEHIQVPLVTADDDVVYADWWLEGLVKAYERNPSVINCYRVHVFAFVNGKPAPYRTWRSPTTTEPRFDHFGTGVSGCIYPIPFLEHLKTVGPQFVDLCPRQDDIWLHVNALRAGYKVKQIVTNKYNFPILPDTQAKSLSKMNVGNDQNDIMIARNYTEAELEMIRNEEKLPYRDSLSNGKLTS